MQLGVFGVLVWFWLNLKGGEEQIDEELGETQTDGGLGGLICHKDKHHLVDTQQRDEGQSRLSQPETGGDGAQ